MSLDTSTGVLSYKTAKGNQLLVEKAVKEQFTPFNDAGNSTYNVYQAFTLDDDEALYGLGQLQNGKMSQRGQVKNLVQGNVEDVSPFIQSTKGYGLFWDNYSPQSLPTMRKRLLSVRRWAIAWIIISCMAVMPMAL